MRTAGPLAALAAGSGAVVHALATVTDYAAVNAYGVPAWAPYGVAAALVVGAWLTWTPEMLFRLLAAFWAMVAGALSAPSPARWAFCGLVFAVGSSVAWYCVVYWWALPIAARRILAAATLAVLAALVSIVIAPLGAPPAVMAAGAYTALVAACALGAAAGHRMRRTA